MKKISKKTYTDALHHATSLLKDDLMFCEFMALLGSVRDSEHIYGYSDLDILFIINSDFSGAIPDNVIKSLKEKCEFLSKKYSIKISFLTHTKYELERYVDFEYLVHYSWGKVIFGNKNEYKKYFNKLIIQKKLKGKDLIQQMLNTIIHARFNLIRRYVSLNIYNTDSYQQDVLKIYIDNLLEITDWRLIADGIWSKNKKELIRFIQEMSKSPNRSVVGDAYRIRRNWNRGILKAKDFERFISRSNHFINDSIRELQDRV